MIPVAANEENPVWKLSLEVDRHHRFARGRKITSVGE
jgi:hypothetical protein